MTSLRGGECGGGRGAVHRMVNVMLLCRVCARRAQAAAKGKKGDGKGKGKDGKGKDGK